MAVRKAAPAKDVARSRKTKIGLWTEWITYSLAAFNSAASIKHFKSLQTVGGIAFSPPANRWF